MPASAVRRHIRHDTTIGSHVAFKLKSLTPGCQKTYRPVLDVETLEFSCDCDDHRFRHRFCKHLRRAAVNCIKHGELPPNALERIGVKCCIHCGETKNIRPLGDFRGAPIENAFICQTCISERNS